MARNADGSVTLKTTGKVATTPRGGSGTANSPSPTTRSVAAGPKVVGVGGRVGPSGKGSVGPRKNYS